MATRIVATVPDGPMLYRWSALAPWSRLVDASHAVPEASRGWWMADLQPANAPDEEAYVRRIEEICDAEAIDTVFPSFEPDLYVLAKNKARLAAQGIVVIAPDLDRLRVPMDKLRTIEAAREASFPCPRTFTPRGPEDLASVIRESEPPWVVKPRLTAHAGNIRIATDVAELRAMFAWVHERQPRPMVQEFIPGWRRQNYYVIADHDLQVLSLLAPKVIRTRQVGVQQSNIACISTADPPDRQIVEALVRRLGCPGCLTIQAIVDPRDGRPKLLEVNPRLGRNLWYRTQLGINEPEIYLRMVTGRPRTAIPPVPEGVHLCDPIEDLRNLIDRLIGAVVDRLRTSLGRAAGTPPYRGRQRIPELLRSMRQSYAGGVPVALSPYTRDVFADPLPCMLHNVRVLRGALRRQRHFTR